MEMKEKKPGLALVIAMKHKKMQGDEEGEKEGNMYSEMADEIIEAISEEDGKALGSALKNFVKVCLAKGDKPNSKDDKEEY